MSGCFTAAAGCLSSSGLSYTATDASGGVFDSTLITNGLDGYSSNFVAGSSYTITKAQIKLKKNGTGGGGTIVVKIYADASGSQGTLLGTSNSIAASSLTGTATLTDFTGLSVSVTSGTTYWVSFLNSSTGGTGGTDNVAVDYNDNTGRTLGATDDAGATWTAVVLPDTQIAFQLFKSP